MKLNGDGQQMDSIPHKAPIGYNLRAPPHYGERKPNQSVQPVRLAGG
jgi:hypothetical protein